MTNADGPHDDSREALVLLHRLVRGEYDPCVIMRDGECHSHGGVEDPDEPGASCTVTRARNLLERAGFPLELPPATTPVQGATAARLRIPAVCMELALTLRQRGTISDRVLANNDYPVTLRAAPVCTILAVGSNHDDALAWTEPLYDGPGGLTDEVWGRWAARHLADEPDTRAWRTVATLTAAYLHGRQPTPDDVLALAERAVTVGWPRKDTDEARRLLCHYDTVADHAIPGGLDTGRPPAGTNRPRGL